MSVCTAHVGSRVCADLHYGSSVLVEVSAWVQVCFTAHCYNPHEISHLKMDGAILETYVAAGACSPVEIKTSGNKGVVLHGDFEGCCR